MENYNLSKHTSFYALGLSYKKADAAIRGKFSLDAQAKATLLTQAEAEGIPAIGFSLMDYHWDADFESTKPFIKQIAQEVLKNKLPEGVVLNVNFPKLSRNEIKGIKICRQAKAIWEERFDKRQSPLGKDYYWLTGEFVNHDRGEDTDEWALTNGYVSIVPVQFDLTAHHAIQSLNSWDL